LESHSVDLDGTLPLKWDSLKFIFKFSTDKEALCKLGGTAEFTFRPIFLG